MIKRIVSLFLVALLVMSFLPLCVFADETWVELKTAADIEKLMKQESSLTANYKLMNDIDISGIASQAPIGNTTAKFAGIFDGQGHTIKGINITAADGNGTGFFGIIANATIKNLTVEGTINGAGQQRIGGLVGSLQPVENGTALIEHCTNKCNVTGKTRTGGILGIGILNVGEFAFSAVIKNCTNEGKITGEVDRIGGVAGSLSPTGAKNRTMVVTGCVNKGEVTGKQIVGGIVGNADTSQPNVVENCINYGYIHSDIAGSTGMIGGVIGRMCGWDVKGCTNNGKVELTVAATSSLVGGIVGRVDANCTVSDNLNNGEIVDVTGNGIGGIVGGDDKTGSGTVDNEFVCNNFNKGIVKAAGDATKTGTGIGEILGINTICAPVNNYYALPANATVHAGTTGTAYTEADFAKLNVNGVWKTASNPVLGKEETSVDTSEAVVTTDAPDTTNAPATTNAPVTTDGASEQNPQTGDCSVLLAIAAVSVIALGAVVVVKKQSVR
ncbi:MAG: hypothetical protein SPJ23_05455 [Eubacteriales bacterium]|nr:hypothetical protein [Eubacteriales bacterium]